MNDRTLADIFCSPGSTRTTSKQKKRERESERDRIGQKCVPLTHVHTFLCIAEILMWKKAVGLLEDCVEGCREQAGGFIEDKQEGAWNLHECYTNRECDISNQTFSPFSAEKDNRNLCFCSSMSGWVDNDTQCAVVNAEQSLGKTKPWHSEVRKSIFKYMV